MEARLASTTSVRSKTHAAESRHTHHRLGLSPRRDTSIVQWWSEQESDACLSRVYAAYLVVVIKKDGNEGLHEADNRGYCLIVLTADEHRLASICEDKVLARVVLIYYWRANTLSIFRSFDTLSLSPSRV